MICHYWLFNHGFEFQDYVYNGFHDLTMPCLNISDIIIVTVKNVDYRCIIHNIIISEPIDLLKNSVLEDSGIYKNVVLKLSLFKTIFVLLFLFSI